MSAREHATEILGACAASAFVVAILHGVSKAYLLGGFG